MKVHYNSKKYKSYIQYIKIIFFLISYKGIASFTHAFCMDLSGSGYSQIPYVCSERS